MSTLPGWLLCVLGLFVPVLREFKEMAYQYDRDYFFDSSKFEKRFGVTPLPPPRPSGKPSGSCGRRMGRCSRGSRRRLW